MGTPPLRWGTSTGVRRPRGGEPSEPVACNTWRHWPAGSRMDSGRERRRRKWLPARINNIFIIDSENTYPWIRVLDFAFSILLHTFGLDFHSLSYTERMFFRMPTLSLDVKMKAIRHGHNNILLLSRGNLEWMCLFRSGCNKLLIVAVKMNAKGWVEWSDTS